VVMRHAHSPGLRDADVPMLAALGPGDGLHTLGPAPAGLHREPGGSRATQAYDVDAGLVRGATLVRRIKVALLGASHLDLLVRSSGDHDSTMTTARSQPSALIAYDGLPISSGGGHTLRMKDRHAIWDRMSRFLARFATCEEPDDIRLLLAEGAHVDEQ